MFLLRYFEELVEHQTELLELVGCTVVSSLVNLVAVVVVVLTLWTVIREEMVAERLVATFHDTTAAEIADEVEPG